MDGERRRRRGDTGRLLREREHRGGQGKREASKAVTFLFLIAPGEFK